MIAEVLIKEPTRKIPCAQSHRVKKSNDDLRVYFPMLTHSKRGSVQLLGAGFRCIFKMVYRG